MSAVVAEDSCLVCFEEEVRVRYCDTCKFAMCNACTKRWAEQCTKKSGVACPQCRELFPMHDERCRVRFGRRVLLWLLCASSEPTFDNTSFSVAREVL